MKREDYNFVLDNAVRHLYITARNKGAQLLGVRFTHRGKRWEADTPEEALRLRQMLDNLDTHEINGDTSREDQYIRSESVWTPDVFESFIRDIGYQQQEAVKAMLASTGIAAEELAKQIRIKPESLGGVLSGLSKQLKRLELKPSDLYLVHTEWDGKTRTRIFFLEKAFRLAAEEVGWPE
jgi:hypothetical protein